LFAATWKLRGLPLIATILALLVIAGTGASENEAWSVAPWSPATFA
jgi:hypothetical protein